MGLNLEKLKEAQETLNKRGGGDGSKNWVTLSKLDAPLDFRILDPLPTMEGLYYLEVPAWWINGVKIISPKLLDPKAKDVCDEILEQAKIDAKADKDLAKILNAKDDKTDMAKIQFKYDYWIPILQFEWKLDRNNAIVGIYAQDGSVDTNLVKQFITDGKSKYLQANITSLKAINTLLTSRGGGMMLDATKGNNIQIQKTGKGRDTKYAVVKMEEMPMPKDLYDFADPFEVAQAMMFDDEYMAAVLEHYLYGDIEVPAKDAHYRFPDVREALKDKYKEDDAPEKETAGPRRRTAYQGVVTQEESPTPQGRPVVAPAAAPAPSRRPPIVEDPAPTDLPWDKDRILAQPDTEVVPPSRTQRGRGASATVTPPVGGRRRNLANDIADVNG